MASVMNSVAATKLGLQEPTCQYSRAASSVSIALPRYAQQCSCQKEILGIALLSQNAPLQDLPFRQQHKLRRFTIEAAKRLDNKRSFLLNTTLKAQESEIDNVAKLCDDIRMWAREKKVFSFSCILELMLMGRQDLQVACLTVGTEKFQQAPTA